MSSPRIQVLDPLVVNQIAAGEVVERPASVVKELVENALDAQARRIDVRVQEGGRALIEVADDGVGMGAEDLARAFLSHATSKVRVVDDLLHVGTLGFRGEALASIGSVSTATLVSRLQDARAGQRVQNREGTIGAVEPTAAPPGTVVRVERLFAHVPARRKFLRSAATELGHISQLMGRFALAFPDVHFTLHQGERMLLDSGPASSRRERIARVHGDDIARALLEVRVVGDPGLEAYVGPPSTTRGDARLQQAFLNGRALKDRTVAHALREAYRDLLPPGGRQPVAFLFLTCDPARVDVNVHPAKAEVRWHDGQGVHRLVHRALRQALEGARPGVGVGDLALRRAAAVEASLRAGSGRAFGAPWPGLQGGAPLAGGGDAVRDRSGPLTLQADSPHLPLVAPEHDPAGQPAASLGRTGRDGLRPVGQALGTYLVLEGEESLVLVDQHALHERVLFEQINQRLRRQGALEVQRLLVPHVAVLGAADAARLVEEREWLGTLGWEVEAFGEDAVAVQGMPAVLRRPDPDAALREVLELLERSDKEGLDRTALLSEAVDRMACRAAVMANDVLRSEEILALLDEAESLNHSHSCPHGRPTRLVLARGDLERWFHRTV